ncbi:MAG: CBS domain-containing protein [Chloroflexota bacterium]|nr:CBS domain-containing protein [Chloroflexota bacterium]
MVTVGQILKVKGSDVWWVAPDATVYDALQKMADKDIGALLVKDGDALIGIFSERDYARKLVLVGKTSMGTPVQEVMTPDVICVTPNLSPFDCMELMTDGRFRHLPVRDGEAVIGVISIGDVVKAIISDQEFTIQQLENYISGER